MSYTEVVLATTCYRQSFWGILLGSTEKIF